MVNKILLSRNGHCDVVTETDIDYSKRSKAACPLEDVLSRMFPDYCDLHSDHHIVIVDDRHEHELGYMRLSDKLSRWIQDYDKGTLVEPIGITIRNTDERDISNPGVYGDTHTLGREVLDYVFTLDIVA